MQVKVYCGKCKWLKPWKPVRKNYLCLHPDNDDSKDIDTWFDRSRNQSYILLPRVRNKDNDCKLFESKPIKLNRWRRLWKSLTQ